MHNRAENGQIASTHEFQVYVEDGITVAETTGGPKYEGELFEYVPLFTLESGDTEETMLFDPSRIIADNDGWFYVYDDGNEDVVVFDPEGRFHTRFGRAGEGPGEFQLAQFLCTVEDMLYIFDRVLMRTTRFRRSGELVDMVSTRQNLLPTMGVKALIPLPGGDRLHLSLGGTPTGPFSIEGVEGRWCDAARMTARGDTVWSWQSEPINNTYRVPITLGRMTRTWTQVYPYSLRPETFYVPELGIVAMASEYPRLDIIDIDGRHIRRIRVDLGDQSITEEDRKAVFDWHDRIINDPREPEDRRISMEAYRKGVRFGEIKAPWTDLRFHDHGYLFLTPGIAQWATPELARTFGFMVISPGGEYLGNTIPPGGRITEIAGGMLLQNRRDAESGEFTLKVYDIRPIVSGLDYPVGR